MLAARCVCALLVAEHAVVRQALCALDGLLQAEGWRRADLVRDQLRALTHFLHAFDARCHAPKEATHLFPLLQGRMAKLDEAIVGVDQARAAGDERLAWALHVLELPGGLQGEPVQGELKDALASYRVSMLTQLALEEDTLFPLARQALREDEWPRIASNISNVPYVARALPELGSPADIARLSTLLPLLRDAMPAGGTLARRPRLQAPRSGAAGVQAY